jgi:uncharacterized cupredoxin-like copper-binding protein
VEPLGVALKDMKGTLLIVAGVFLAAAIVVGFELATYATGPGGDVGVTLTNFRIGMDPTLSAGRHTFAVTNAGNVPHELVVFRTDLPGNALPTKLDGSVNEESPLLQSVADSGNGLAPGAGRSVPAKLSPGHYVAVCNLPGHYRLGMRLDLTVK